MQQVQNSSYKKIKLGNSNRVCYVDRRDYERLREINWSLQTQDKKLYACCMRDGKQVLMHREIVGYHSPDFFTHISHLNGNSLDNRFDNLVVRSSNGRRTRFHASAKLRNRLNEIAPVLAIAKNGVVHHHNLVGVIENSQKEIDLLLCQRLKAAQLISESRSELLSCKEQLAEALAEIDRAIASMDRTMQAMQP